MNDGYCKPLHVEIALLLSPHVLNELVSEWTCERQKNAVQSTEWQVFWALPVWTRSGHVIPQLTALQWLPITPGIESKYLSVADFAGLLYLPLSSSSELSSHTVSLAVPIRSLANAPLFLSSSASPWGSTALRGVFGTLWRKYFYCHDREAGLFLCILQRTGQAEIAKNNALSHVAGLDTSGSEKPIMKWT